MVENDELSNPIWLRYGIKVARVSQKKWHSAILAVSVLTVCFFINQAFFIKLGGSVTIIPFAGIVLISILSGFWSGLLSSCAASFLIYQFYFRSNASSYGISFEHFTRILVFLVLGLLVASLSGILRAAVLQAEQARQEYLNLISWMNHAILWEIDPNTFYHSFVSKRAVELLKYPIQAWYSEKSFFFHRVYEEDRQQVWSTFLEVLSGKSDLAVDHRMEDRSGKLKWYHTGFHLDQRKGESRIRALTVEIHLLKSAQEKLAFLFQSTSLMIADQLDYPANLGQFAQLALPELADLCILDVIEDDRIFREIAKFNPDSVSSSRPVTLETRFLSEFQIQSKIGEVVRTGQLKSQFEGDQISDLARKLELENKDLNHFFKCTWVILPLIARGKILGALTLISSFPQRKNQLIDLEVAQELASRVAMTLDNSRLYQLAQQSTRIREGILALVSHDLKSPLSAILMGTALQLKAIPENAPGLKKHTLMIRRSAERMKRLIEDLLDLSKIQENKLLLSLKEENVAEILKEVMEIFRPIAEQKNVHLLNPFSEIETQQTVYCDHDRVLQVFSNILGNAIKFTPEEGVIEIHAKTEGEEVIFSVKDSGPGIAKEDLANVFERYWQAKRTSHQGTGIGLTIAKGIVETHGGRIWVKSHLGEGSCFYFSLSAHQTKNLSRKIA